MKPKPSDTVFVYLTRLQIDWHGKKEPQSFRAKIKGGTVYVECRGYEVYIESYYPIPDDKDDRHMVDRFAGTTVAAANRLEALGIDMKTVETEGR